MTMPNPDVGTWANRSPAKALDARHVTNRAAAGATLGARMWFHEDMTNALTNGQQKAGWTGGTDEQGRRYVRLTALGVQHTWVLTGERQECPQIPGTWLEEGIWPD